MTFNYLGMRVHTILWAAGTLLAACTLGPKTGNDGGDASADTGNDTGGNTGGNTSGNTGGSGPVVTTAPDTTAPDPSDPTVPTVPTSISSATEPDDTAGDGDSFSDTDVDSESFPGTDPTEEPDGFDTEDDDCNEDTWLGVNQPGFHELLNEWDQQGLDPVACPWNHELCSEAPIDGLMSALVVRNDRLPAPREFVSAGARWVVWSNVALDCADPFGAPLCDGDWRISFAVSSGTWCHAFLNFGWGSGYSVGQGSPFIVEDGDADCVTTAFAIADFESSADVHFSPEAGMPYFQPIAGTLCSPCAVPGGPDLVTGSWSATICPE